MARLSFSTLLALCLSSALPAQPRVVDVQVRSSRGAAQMDFIMVATAGSVTLGDSARTRTRTDTVRARTPFAFSVDLDMGPVILESNTLDHLDVDVFLKNGSMINGLMARMRIRRDGKRVEVAGTSDP